MHRALAVGSVLTVALLVAGCKGSDKSQSATFPPSSASTSHTGPAGPSSTTPPPTPAASSAVSSAAGPPKCTQQGQYRAVITRGDTSCANANKIASGFDTQGQAVQHVGSYTCELGNASTRPVIFTCTGAESEFSVQEATGPQHCSKVDKYQIVITGGRLTCSAAYTTAFNFNTQGQAVQHVGSYTCELGNASTRPVIFTCTGAGSEFSVNQP